MGKKQLKGATRAYMRRMGIRYQFPESKSKLCCQIHPVFACSVCGMKLCEDHVIKETIEGYTYLKVAFTSGKKQYCPDAPGRPVREHKLYRHRP